MPAFSLMLEWLYLRSARDDAKTLAHCSLVRRSGKKLPLIVICRFEVFMSLAPTTPALASLSNPSPLFVSSFALTMGLFSASTSPSQPSTPKPLPDGGYEAPNRNARAHCWQARDAFFDCLERNGIEDSIKDADQAQKLCGEEGKGFERDCASSWVRATLIDSVWKEIKKDNTAAIMGHFLSKIRKMFLNASS